MTDGVPASDLQTRLRDLDPERRAEIARRLEKRKRAAPRRRPTGSPPVLSYEQERLWLLDQLTPGLAAYNASRVLRIAGPLEVAWLQRALDAVVDRHEVLRTNVRAVEGRPVPSLGPPLPVALEIVDIGPDTGEDAETAVRRFLAVPFDLADDVLLRALLVRLGPEDHVLALCVHHIASDGTSRQLLLNELGALYEGFVTDSAPALPPVGLQFSDVAAWQRAVLDGARQDLDHTFWTRYLADAPPTIELPFDRQRPPTQDYGGRRLTTSLPGPVVERLATLARSQGATPFMGMVAAFSLLLSRLSRQDDLVIGTPVNSRSLPELDDVMGMLSDTLPLRVVISPDAGFADLVDSVRESAGSAFAHGDLPFEKIVQLVHPARDPSRPPLVQVLINNVGSGVDQQMRWGGLTVSPVDIDPGTSQADLSLAVVESGDAGNLTLVWEWCTALWDEPSVIRMAGQFETLLDAALAAPDRPCATLPLMDEVERQRLLTVPNATGRPLPDENVPALIARQAALRGATCAVEAPDGSATYRELDDRSNALAQHLRSRGIGRGDRVAVHLDRSVQLLVGLVGIMKAGAAYVPLDPGYPSDRIDYILDDAGVKAVLTSSDLAAGLPPDGPPQVIADLYHDGPVAPVDDGPRPTDLAYVIYTSGSTGRPKGVMIEHRGLSNILAVMAERPGLTAGEVMVGITTLTFDVSLPDLFLPLITGATLVLAASDVAREPTALAALIERSRADVMQATPATWQMLIESGWPGRDGLRIVCGGEGYGASLVEALSDRVAEIWNFYGPTETTVWSVCTRLGRGASDPLPIGLPIANTTCYVLDDRGAVVPVGVPGELHIGGIGVARGYVNRPDQDASHFIADPFGADPSSRLYRTGDLAMWRSDGQLVCLGRTDHQVKLRGYRIELGEIEAVLTDCAEVAQAAVIVREDTPGNQRLVAYCTVSGPTADVEEIGDHLRRRLPVYMVPTTIVLLDALPLTASGKLDRKALPRPDDDRVTDGGHDQLSTPTEKALARFWSEIIGIGPVSASDDFFDLGGHSLLATRLAARIASDLGVTVPLGVLFEEPVLQRFAAAVDRLGTREGTPTDLPPLLRADRDARRLAEPPPGGDPEVLARALEGKSPEPDGGFVAFPASSAQGRMWVLEQLEPGRALYNVPVARRVVGPVDVVALESALGRLAARHEILRTSLAEHGGVVSQIVHPTVTIPCDLLEPSAGPDTWAGALDATVAEALRPFDLTEAPLIRVTLARAGTADGASVPAGGAADDQWLLCLTAHHSIVDGASVQLLLHELRQHYEALTTGSGQGPRDLPSVDYGDCVVWQRDPALLLQEDEGLRYWREELDGAPPVLDFPFDHPRPAAQSHRGGRAFHRLDPQVAAGVRRTAVGTSSTLFMTVLAAWGALLARYSGQEDIVVGLPVTGRNGSEMDDVVGLFVNTLPLRIRLAGDPTLTDLIGRTRTAVLDGMQRQHVPFERIVDEQAPGRDLSRHPVFQVLATMQPEPPGDERLGAAKLSPVPIDWGWSRFADLSLVVMEHGGELDLGLEYSSDLLEPATAERLCRQLEDLLEVGAADPDLPVSHLVSAAAERHQNLVDRNGTTRPIPSGRRIHDLFADQVASTPDAIALEFEDATLTYADLDARANQLAHRLVELGVGPDTIVAICIERSMEMVVAMLAILKAGGAYLPVDTAYPQERIEYMLGDADAGLLLTMTPLLPRLGDHAGRFLCLDEAAESLLAYPTTVPDGRSTSDDLAYVIYTSGSTGYPKGALIEHRGVVNLALDVIDSFALDSRSRVLQFASFTFDASILDLVIPLCVGATVCLARQEVLASVPDLTQLLQDRRITTVTLPPSLLAVMPDATFPHLATVCAAGEACHPELVRRWGTGRRFINGYGPTEATVLTTTFTVTGTGEVDHESLPIGRPLSNVEVYVLDEQRRPVPIGCPGELYIGGPGLARGYLGRPELTAERFVAHPFVDTPDARLYRSGDCVRWLADGTLEYRGRFDNQVKFRGYRIELGEIEQTLIRHAAIRNAVVVVRTDVPNEQRLVAYLNCEDGPTPVHAELRAFLRQSLPDYMVPAAFVVLETLPVSPNGKIDRGALPTPSGPAHPGATFRNPQGPLEELVAGIWCDVLEIDGVGADDDVYELGANSLDAARVASHLRSHGVDVSLRDLFDHATVASIARRILEGLSDDSVDTVDELLMLTEGEGL
ncbi:MAG: amino acid adenylation domain-containing protein [Acidimicrobiales bacterium]|jgi:amino acid adenylation domain-containing protein